MQDHGRVPYRPLQLHEHAGAQAESLECISARIGSVPWMRRSEVSALRWADVAAEAYGDGGCWSPSAGARRTRRARRRTSGS